MKDLFTKISDSVLNTCKEAVDQTQKTVDQTRYRTEIITLKNELKKLYQQLGEQHYHAHTQGDEAYSNATLCNRITKVVRDIRDLEQRIGDVVDEQKDSFESFKKDVKTTWQEENRTYEPKRDANGIKMLKFCQHCDIGNAVDAEVCINCGHQFEQ